MMRYLHISLWIISVIGCYVQLKTTLSTYFHFQTITETRTFVPAMLFEPDLSICIRYVDIVGIPERDVYNHTLTLRQIFDRSSPADQLIAECMIRLRPSRLAQKFKNSECLKYFSISKYFTQEYICYQVSPVHQYLSFQSYASSLWYPGTIYWIYLNETLAQKIAFVKPFVHGSGLPLISSVFARYFHRYSANESSFTITHATHHYKHIGFPYNDFRCGFKGERAICTANCTTRLSLEAFGKLLFDVIFSKPMDHRILSGKDMKVDGAVDKVENIHQICADRCNMMDCDGNYTLSTVSVALRERFVIRVFSPDCPDVLAIAVPKVSLLDLVVYVMSALGTWFGFVVVDMSFMKYFTIVVKYSKKFYCKYQHRKNVASVQNVRRRRRCVPSLLMSDYILYTRRLRPAPLSRRWNRISDVSISN